MLVFSLFFDSCSETPTQKSNDFEILSALNRKIINGYSVRLRVSRKPFSGFIHCEALRLCHRLPFPINFYWIASQQRTREALWSRRLFHSIHKLFITQLFTLHKISWSSSILAREITAQKIQCTKRTANTHSAFSVHINWMHFIVWRNWERNRHTDAFATQTQTHTTHNKEFVSEKREMKVDAHWTQPTQAQWSGLADSMIRLREAVPANE